MSVAKVSKKHYRSECVDKSDSVAYRVKRVFKRSEFVRKHKETAQKTPYQSTTHTPPKKTLNNKRISIPNDLKKVLCLKNSFATSEFDWFVSVGGFVI